MAECILGGTNMGGLKIASGIAPSTGGTVDLTSYGFTTMPAVALTPINGTYADYAWVTALTATSFTYTSYAKTSPGVCWIAVGK